MNIEEEDDEEDYTNLDPVFSSWDAVLLAWLEANLPIRIKA